MNTVTLRNNLINPSTSEYDRGETLATLIKHNLYSHLSDQLKECYFIEDYKGAYDLIKDITITTIKPRYTQHKPKTRRGDSRQTIGTMMVTQGNNTGWKEGIQIMERLAVLEIARQDPTLAKRVSRYREILKRKARLAKAKRVSKQGKTTKYNKRERVILPSQR